MVQIKKSILAKEILSAAYATCEITKFDQGTAIKTVDALFAEHAKTPVIVCEALRKAVEWICANKFANCSEMMEHAKKSVVELMPEEDAT